MVWQIGVLLIGIGFLLVSLFAAFILMNMTRSLRTIEAILSLTLDEAKLALPELRHSLQQIDDMVTGVNDKLAKNIINVSDPVVKRIRVSQFKSAPDAVTRVVLDVDEKSAYRVTKVGEALQITFGDSPAMAATPVPAPVPVPKHEEQPRAGEKDWFETVNREVTTTRRSVGVCDVSTFGKIEIEGADAVAFLDRVCANTLSTLPVYKARYALMLRLYDTPVGVATRTQRDAPMPSISTVNCP